MFAQRRRANALMLRSAAGDREAFGRLAELAGEAVYRFCLAHLRRRADAEDARQECLLRAYQRRADFRPDGDAAAWLLGIAMNVVREQRRRRPDAPLGRSDPPAAPQPAGDERLARLAEAVEALPERQREAVTCRYLLGLSVRDTARTMGCAEGTVKASAFQALRKLHRMLTRDRP